MRSGRLTITRSSLLSPTCLDKKRIYHKLVKDGTNLENDSFSYAEVDWEKIKRWVERVTGQFLDAFESFRNPLQNDCHEREWTGDYIIPLIQGALKLDGNFYVP